jgi:hypothetical protein
MDAEFNTEKDIDQLIYAAAEYEEFDNYHLLYKKILAEEMFFSLVEKNEIEKTRSNTGNGDDFKIPTVLANNGMSAVVFHTKPDDIRLSKKYAGMPGRRGLEMVLEIPDVDGIIIQNSDDSWFAIPKEQIAKILNSF